MVAHRREDTVMSSDIVLKLEHCIEIQDAMRRNGITPDVLKKITSGDFLASVRDVANGYAVITVPEHLIDCDADPFIPSGWKVEEHQKGGAFKFDAAQVQLYLDKGQQNGKYIEGNKLRTLLAGKPVLNANVLDYLLANPHLIPDDWKKDEKGNTRYIFFWGTVYRHSDGSLYVRALCWDGGGWDWSVYWLDLDWGGFDPAALHAS